jgi:hypothetical protein
LRVYPSTRIHQRYTVTSSANGRAICRPSADTNKAMTDSSLYRIHS